VVRDDNGNWMEPNIYDIDDSELPKQTIGNWICMGVAMGCVLIIFPFFLLCLFFLTRGNNAKLAASSDKSSLPSLH